MMFSMLVVMAVTGNLKMDLTSSLRSTSNQHLAQISRD